MNSHRVVPAILLLALASASSAQASGICERSISVQKSFCAQVRKTCAQVDNEDLAKITDLSFFQSDGLKPNDFLGLSNLKVLKFSYNGSKLGTLKAGVFNGLTSLESLIMSSSSITSIESGVFKNLPKLTELTLDRNLLSTIQSDTFHDLPALKTLDLELNQLAALPENAFAGDEALVTLKINDNPLSEIASNSLRDLPSLQEIFLEQNKLQSLPDDFLQGLNSLKRIHLRSNPNLRIDANLWEAPASLQYAFVDGVPAIPTGSENALKLVSPELYPDHHFCENLSVYDGAYANVIGMINEDYILGKIAAYQHRDPSEALTPSLMTGYYCSQNTVPLTPGEYGMIVAYQGSASVPHAMNMDLRNAKSPSDIPADDRKGILNLEHAIQKFAPLPAELVVYRGEKAFQGRPNYEVGKTYPWASFTSTSITKESGITFLTDAPNEAADSSTDDGASLPSTLEIAGSPILYTIHLKTGENVLYFPILGSITAPNYSITTENAPLTGTSKEEEVLVSPGSVFQVEHISRSLMNQVSVIEIEGTLTSK